MRTRDELLVCLAAWLARLDRVGPTTEEEEVAEVWAQMNDVWLQEMACGAPSHE